MAQAAARVLAGSVALAAVQAAALAVAAVGPAVAAAAAGAAAWVAAANAPVAPASGGYPDRASQACGTDLRASVYDSQPHHLGPRSGDEQTQDIRPGQRVRLGLAGQDRST